MKGICYVTDILPGESDMLTPVKNGDLELITDEGSVLKKASSPSNGWTHAVLMENYSEVDFLGAVDAYISDVWVGSTEV